MDVNSRGVLKRATPFIKRPCPTFSIAHSGFSLVELLMVLAISGWIMAQGTPKLYEWLGRFQAHAALKELKTTLDSARYQSLVRNFSIRVCPAGSTREIDGAFEYRCGDHWQLGTMMYAVSVNELDTSSQWIKESYVINFAQRSSTNRWFIALKNTQAIPYLTFHPNGRLSGGNGRFIGCIKNRPLPIQSQLVFFYTGRTYFFKSRPSEKDQSLCSDNQI